MEEESEPGWTSVRGRRWPLKKRKMKVEKIVQLVSFLPFAPSDEHILGAFSLKERKMNALIHYSWPLVTMISLSSIFCNSGLITKKMKSSVKRPHRLNTASIHIARTCTS